ncbi:PD-(D/E)XK nuclease family protein [Vibrio parahaemolyticus]|uniref:PDDEXK-like family protein n=1 Tax=Vibrio parahaemolyticus TaxID=670 RepID=UPI001FAD2680|nr:PD-(D/E)XK nuclease family protein [Vibrio parahaemolyticus]MCI9705802.1 PD-(D/E)XK nuclease family protein [Vibrio parahaemolyticus]MDF5481233.1 PD-(D/E)XK nuclease family protein [Vibrio parahaemolyticus]MDG2837100.1 PD-(D/E)XK nuclease family protein [Vibrio parahaemolyticus]
MDKAELSRYEALLEKIKGLPSQPDSETSIFGIGSKGYFENPTTDILAFFCDDNGDHRLNALVLESLVQCLPESVNAIDCSLCSSPEREVTTESGKRIDLLLEADDWVIVLENKIYHHQNNPFDDYEAFVSGNKYQRFKNKQPIFVVLSPSGDAPQDYSQWHGVSYPKLIQAIKDNLSQHFFSQPLNKWVILLREFILHLETLMTTQTTPEETLEFVLKNLGDIQKLQELKSNAINDYHQELQQLIQEQIEQSVKIRLHHWYKLPALRFALESWQSKSDVVFHLDGDESYAKFNLYAHLPSREDAPIAEKYISAGHKHSWFESCYRGYDVFIPNASKEQIVNELVKRLKMMDAYELAVRPSDNRG